MLGPQHITFGEHNSTHTTNLYALIGPERSPVPELINFECGFFLMSTGKKGHSFEDDLLSLCSSLPKHEKDIWEILGSLK